MIMKQEQLLIYFSFLIALSYGGYVPQWIVNIKSEHDANIIAIDNGLINKGKVCHIEAVLKHIYIYIYICVY